MVGKFERAHDYARITLAGIRLFNGVAALFVPATLARRLGVDPEANPAALYALRLFGVRTVLIGAQLLLRDSGVRAHSLRVAPVIHALDATAALIAGDRGQLCPGARLRRQQRFGVLPDLGIHGDFARRCLRAHPYQARVRSSRQVME